METSENIFPDLQILEGEIDKKLQEDFFSKESYDFYNALKYVISLKLNSHELQSKFEQFREIFNAMAMGDFSHRIDLPNRKNLFSVMASSLNLVNEELNFNVVKTQYLEVSLEYIPHIAIITDKAGIIIFVNNQTLKSFERQPEDLIKLRIANLFESKTQFGIIDPDFNDFEEKEVGIIYFSKSFKADLTVKVIFNKIGETDGYLYIIKQK